jgi:hypothetical protein
VLGSIEPEDIVVVIPEATIIPGPTLSVVLGDGAPLITTLMTEVIVAPGDGVPWTMPLMTEAMVAPCPVPVTGVGLFGEIEIEEIGEFELIRTPEAV